MAKLTKHELARLTITDTICSLYSDDTVDIDDLIAKYGTGLRIRWESGYYDDPDSVTIIRVREETDTEYNDRINEAKAIKAAHAAQALAVRKKSQEEERQTYLRLKAKYG
jgi:hypothetical protein